jgi:zinc protease
VQKSSMLDRTQAPAFNTIQSRKLPAIENEILANNIPLFTAGFANQDVVKLELVFNAGSGYEAKDGISALFSKMLLGGTTTLSSSEIMEGFDQYGAFIEISSRVERLHIVLYGLQKYLEKYLILICDVIKNSTFPKEEIEVQRKIALQNLKLNLEKSTYLASSSFKSQIFGDYNPYGKVLNSDHLKSVQRDDLVTFYDENIKNKAFKVFLSGKIGENEKNEVRKYLGQIAYEKRDELNLDFDGFTANKILIEKKDKMQSTLRLGRPLFERTHPDFFKMILTNTALGGYFGSRLMKNIREDKGYTYGISSNITPMKEFGYLTIGTDVVKENTLDTLAEIKKEISILQSIEMEEDELETIKNYMCGSYAGSLTTAFEVMDMHINRILSELPDSYYDNFLDKIKGVTTKDVLEMSQKYLSLEEMTEVIVGERI